MEEIALILFDMPDDIFFLYIHSGIQLGGNKSQIRDTFIIFHCPFYSAICKIIKWFNIASHYNLIASSVHKM